MYGTYTYHKIQNYSAWEKIHVKHKNKIRQTSIKVLQQTAATRYEVLPTFQDLTQSPSCWWIGRTTTDDQLSYRAVTRCNDPLTPPTNKRVTFQPAPLANAGSHNRSRRAGHQLWFYQATSKMVTGFSTWNVGKPSHLNSVCLSPRRFNTYKKNSAY